MTTSIFIIVSANNSANNNFEESYCFLKLMSNKEMSNNKNTLQLPPQFPSISSGESESETEYSSFGKLAVGKIQSLIHKLETNLRN